ncbi:hypothetical protein VTK73DRAFT_3456 [Phialemonium thermophilum]|uniref:Uncharacterized protein n=1 Tax=Phialemonium thermophilum TaxID=223376 RepID=A0ABR3VI54_9PEZI
MRRSLVWACMGPCHATATTAQSLHLRTAAFPCPDAAARTLSWTVSDWSSVFADPLEGYSINFAVRNNANCYGARCFSREAGLLGQCFWADAVGLADRAADTVFAFDDETDRFWLSQRWSCEDIRSGRPYGAHSVHSTSLSRAFSWPYLRLTGRQGRRQRHRDRDADSQLLGAGRATTTAGDAADNHDMRRHRRDPARHACFLRNPHSDGHISSPLILKRVADPDGAALQRGSM